MPDSSDDFELARSTDGEAILPESKQEEIAEIAQLLVRQNSQFSGPVPSPSALAEYEKIYEGSARIFFELLQKQVNHKIEMEETIVETQKTVVCENFLCQKIGLFLGFIIALVGLGSSVTLALNGREVTASVVGGGTLVGLATAFIVGSKGEKRKSDTDKSDEEE